MDSILQVAIDRAPLIALSSVVLLGYWIIPHLQTHHKLAKFPIYGAENGRHLRRERMFLTNSETIYLQGYHKFPNTIHRITTADGEQVVLPLKYLEELRQRPDDEIDNHIPLRQSLEADNTGLLQKVDANFLAQAVKTELTRNLARINPTLCLEVDRTITERIPKTDGWASYAVEAMLLPIVTTVSGCVFVGPQLCRAPEYVDACANYTVSFMRALRALKQWPKWVRRLGRYLTPELKVLERYRASAARILMPAIKERREDMRRGTKEGPDDMLQWMLAKAEKENISDKAMCGLQLTLIMAAIHTTVRATTQILFELASCPEVIPAIRKEIEAALAEQYGVMNTQALFQMKLLDSAMKESQRLNPAGLSRFQRYICKPICLSDGTYIPANTNIEVPWYPVTRDEAIYPNADKFDPYRFYRMRTAEAADGDGNGTRLAREQYQFASISKADMSFGWGRHACPGRFFAANEIKLILARLLLDYDIALPEGLEKRPENIIDGGLRVPLPGAEIRLRKRRDS